MSESDVGLLRSIWISGFWRFFPFLGIYILGIAILFPILPSIVTNGFASEAAGRPVNCEVGATVSGAK